MGCRFCASTLEGLARNLLPGEMLEQIYRMEEDTGEMISHVVVMGSGEPLDNYDNLVRFLRLLTDENGLNISQRNVTVSTCGIVPAIYRFAQEELHVTLALSLHAPNDALRRQIMPVARALPQSMVSTYCPCRVVMAEPRISMYCCTSRCRSSTLVRLWLSGVCASMGQARQSARLMMRPRGPDILFIMNNGLKICANIAILF